MKRDRKAYQRNYQRDWMRQRRLKWILENGPCATCGSWENLECDHIDPSKKLCSPASIWGRSEAFRKTELAKCQVLCEKCHLEKTKKETRKEGEHGTYFMYNKRGCRCEPCRAARSKLAYDGTTVGTMVQLGLLKNPPKPLGTWYTHQELNLKPSDP